MCFTAPRSSRWGLADTPAHRRLLLHAPSMRFQMSFQCSAAVFGFLFVVVAVMLRRTQIVKVRSLLS